MVTNKDVHDAMRKFGGSFIKALAEAFDCADPTNHFILKTAFRDYWRQYTRIAADIEKAK